MFGSYGTLMTQMDMIEWDRSPVAEFIKKPGGPEILRDRSPVAEFIE